MALKVTIVDIDSQNDFTDPNGSLYVKGAEENSKRLAGLIERLTKAGKITRIIRTFDSHSTMDISHNRWFVDSNGNHPAPFTIIGVADMESYRWNTTVLGRRARTLAYLKALEAAKRYPHCIWPDHCLIGSPGHNMNPDVFAAILEWERKNNTWADSVTKGSNPWTEHFSAIRAEVPDPQDLSTQVNDKLVQVIEDSDITIWGGEALSHCLANTFRDAIAAFSNSDRIKNMVLARDCTSSVPGFESFGDQFIQDMVSKGMQVKNAADILA